MKKKPVDTDLLAELQAARHRIATLEQELEAARRLSLPANPEQKLNKLLEILPVGVSILDANRQIVFSNPAVAQILDITDEGLQRGDYVNRQYLASDGSPMSPRDFASVRATHSGQAVHNVETGVVKEDGETIWTNVSAVPVDFPDWKTVIVTSDITARKRAEEKVERQNQRLKVLRELDTSILGADSVPDLINTALSRIRKLVDCGRVSLTLFEWEKQEAEVFDVNDTGGTLLPPGTRIPLAPFQAMLQILEKNQPFIIDNLPALLNPPPELQNLIQAGFRSQCILPLFSQNDLIGVLAISSERIAFFDEEKVNTGREVANQIALALTQNKLLNDLRESEQRYILLFQKSSIPVVLGKLPEVVIADANESAEALTGYTREEMIGKNAVDLGLIGQSQRTRTIAQYEQEGSLAENEMRIVTKSGEERIIIFNTHPLKIGGQPFAITSMQDITARKRAEEKLRQSEARFGTIFVNSPIAIGISRVSDRKIVDVNDAFVNFYGYTREEIIGCTTAELDIWANLADRQRFAELLQVHKHVNSLETVARLKSGQECPVLVWGEFVTINNEPCLLAQIVDITERKRAEEDLRRSNAELEQFAYVASHDLQEPLRTVAGMVELLKERYKDTLDERADTYISHAVDASLRMQKLINDLLEYSRVNRFGKPFELVSMETVLETTLQNLHMAIAESQAVITHDPLPTVNVDPTQMVHVLQNLLGNAIKFRSTRPLEIHISAQMTGNAWQFSLRDNGIGIEPRHFERIFVVFQRLHTRRDYPGTGIGLSLCKKIIERHGGKIWLESVPHQGTTFHFLIPEKRHD